MLFDPVRPFGEVVPDMESIRHPFFHRHRFGIDRFELGHGLIGVEPAGHDRLGFVCGGNFDYP